MSEEKTTLDVRLIQQAVRFWRRRRKTALLILGALALLSLLASGIYTVPTNQTGALLFLGKLIRDDVEPGIHLKLPTPLQEIRLMNTSEVRRMNLAGQWRETVSLITGDENVIRLDVALQYAISRYGPFLIGSENWEQVVRLVVMSSMTELIAQMSVDEVLTTGKSRIQNDLRTLAQRKLDKYNSGLTVISTTIVTIKPPQEAAASFRRVADAKSEKAKKVNVAEARRRRELAQARGKAERLLRAADSEYVERIKKAQGDAERYLAILAEYRQAKQVTKLNLYMQRMENVLNKARLILFNPQEQGPLDLNLFSPRRQQSKP